jgi:rare lipoprotein A
MKRFGAVLVLGLLVSFFCSAQTQTGNASYNESKTGYAISHSSLSFNTRVRVTNLRNNRAVEATVTGRIPISSERIADISKDAADDLGMARTGMTLVEIEPLPLRGAASAPDQPAVTASDPEPPPPAAVAPSAAPAPASPQSGTPQTTAPAAVPTATQTQAVQTITEEIRYIPVAAAPAACPCTPLLPIFLCLLILVLILLLVILIIYLRHFYLWRKYHRIWLRRHYWYIKRRRD